MEFKDQMIALQKRLSDVRARSKTPIKEDLSNLIHLDDLIVQLSSECEEIMWTIIQMRVSAEKVYYDVLNDIAKNYHENELPIYIKANPEYQKANRRIHIIDHLMEEAKRTQQSVNNRRYGLTNALRSRQLIAEIRKEV